MNILVTGHDGLVGSNLFKRLKGESLFGMSLENGFDLRDEKMVDTVIGNFKPDVVYHLAAFAAEARGQVSPVDMTQRNIGIFVNVLKASINAGVKKFVYTSSVAVYGEAGTPYKEDGETIPKDVYGVNKLASEQILKIMAKVYGFEYVIIRPHNIYGPGQKMDDPYKNVVALFMRKLLENEPYIIFGEGKMQRAFSYVDDVVDVLVQCLHLSNLTMNVGSDKAISIQELSEMVQEVSGISVPIDYQPARPQEIAMFLADHSLQNTLVDYKETPLREGLEKTWAWVKKNKLPEVITIDKEIYV
jgi:UDP-glucose 4-epimerase